MVLINCIFLKAQKQNKKIKPNIVFFLVDDLGWSDLGCYGSEFYETPNIDSLAKQGIRFTDAYSACHVCSPSRASILTGKYPASLNLTDWLTGRPSMPYDRLKGPKINQHLQYNETTIAEILKDLGYKTGIFGKWHLGENPSNPMAHGFDIHLPNWAKGWPNKGYFAPFGLDGFDDSNAGEYLTDKLTSEAIKYIEENKENPFFIYVSYFAVHDPIQGRKDLVKKYKDKLKNINISTNLPFILEGNPDKLMNPSREELIKKIKSPNYSNKYQTFDEDLVLIKQNQDNVEFAAMIDSVDESLGKILKKIKDLNLDENTIIFFYSDNGGMAAMNGTPWTKLKRSDLNKAFSTSNLPLRGAKGWLYEGGIRVPLIIKHPKKGKMGLVSNLPVSSVDMFPTILSMIAPEIKINDDIEGIDLSPVIKGENIERGPIYWHFPHYSNHGMQSPGGAIRDGDFKLIEYFENGTVQLFNLKHDIGELKDISKIEIEKTTELIKKLNLWREKNNAKMMKKNSNYNKNFNRNTNPWLNKK
ncbi:MAG: sulfatase [Flavobacteriaceae bacterium]|nr:sulfatase [Flavobacteriaceae bacterium]